MTRFILTKDYEIIDAEDLCGAKIEKDEDGCYVVRMKFHGISDMYSDQIDTLEEAQEYVEYLFDLIKQ